MMIGNGVTPPLESLLRAVQASEGMAPLPAEPPIGGPIWTVLIPALLLLGSFLATYGLYKRFAREEEEG